MDCFPLAVGGRGGAFRDLAIQMGFLEVWGFGVGPEGEAGFPRPGEVGRMREGRCLQTQQKEWADT